MPTFAHLSNAAVLADLGQRVERHRIARNLTQAQLAGEVGVSRATAQRLESSKSVQLRSLVRLWGRQVAAAGPLCGGANALTSGRGCR